MHNPAYCWTKAKYFRSCLISSSFLAPVSASMSVTSKGNDFAAYRSEDEDVAAAFRLLPDVCLSRLSRAASARGTICDHNLALLCSPGVTSLWLRGRFSDQVSVVKSYSGKAPRRRSLWGVVMMGIGHHPPGGMLGGHHSDPNPSAFDFRDIKFYTFSGIVTTN